MSDPGPEVDATPEDDEPEPMPCPTCGAPLRWLGTELDTEGGWWRCRHEHRWRLRDGELVTLGAA